MHQPKLHSSQELTVHQVNAEQTFSPSSVSNNFPHSPSAFRPISGGAHTPLGQAPGGSSSTATASIIRPTVRHRPEWVESLEDVEPYSLPTHFIACTSSAPERPEVKVRYIADQYDRSWLAHRVGENLSHYASSSGGNYVWGKTGQVGSLPQAANDLGVSLFEDIITSFELAAYYNSEIPLERLNGVDSGYLDQVHASQAVISEVRQYWLRKREAMGGHIPCIAALRLTVREDNQNALCHPDVLGDCPLPFKYRDWAVPTVVREGPPPQEAAAASHARKEKRQREDKGAESTSALPAFIQTARSLSDQILQREHLHHQHTLLSLYELAALRNLSGPPNASGSTPWDGQPSSSSGAAPQWTQPIPLEKEKLLRAVHTTRNTLPQL